jgi:hypothetical protein
VITGQKTAAVLFYNGRMFISNQGYNRLCVCGFSTIVDKEISDKKIALYG